MSDGDDFRDMRKARQESHRRLYEQNMAILRKSGLQFEVRETSVLFRDSGKPKVDFFPHTGRWRIVDKSVTGKPLNHTGGASRFIAWYRQWYTPPTLDFNDDMAKRLTAYANTMDMGEWRVARIGDKYQIIYTDTGTEVCEPLTAEGVEGAIDSASAGYAEDEE